LFEATIVGKEQHENALFHGVKLKVIVKALDRSLRNPNDSSLSLLGLHGFYLKTFQIFKLEEGTLLFMFCCFRRLIQSLMFLC